ncbi:hypothetical protein GALMADRAFT_279330 [Galerina marginata CBS 339.88]|uniref:DUF7918 domain-containing protein n=1 Tax=Galerina marginata (strain CBS 339.88) TaxID=685588 RepID=A0A067SZ02_GALM3|nr:hypothetical protein GALMADRAFT_279330 [Galerina marginata CBS 339.88]
MPLSSSQLRFPTRLVFKEFEACIFVDGQKVPHYDIECNEEKREVSCWIESQAEKPFAYEYRRKNFDHDCGVAAYLDGAWVENTVVLKTEFPTFSKLRSSVRISRNKVRPLIFGQVELTDDDAYLERSSQRNIGYIKIVFEKIRVISRNNIPTPRIDVRRESTQLLHENSEKGRLSHQVSYGKLTQNERGNSPGSYKTRSCGVLATFIFKYRPLAVLQADGIAPLPPVTPTMQLASRPPAPPPINKKRKCVEEDQEIVGDREKDLDAKERTLLRQLEKVRKEKLKLQIKSKRKA